MRDRATLPRTEERLRPTALEIATGTILGNDPEAPLLPEIPPGLTPRRALELAVLPALGRPPCLVSFSGGRDSSAVLAVAVDVARREGLPLPVPVTVRFSEAPGASEPEWQEAVVRHVGLSDWLRLEVGDELDLVGPLAARILRRHGVVYPVNACLYALLFEHTAGGSLLTGTGGDSMFGGWIYWHPSEVLRGRARPRASDALLAAHALAPRPLRRLVHRLRVHRVPWLRPEAQRAFANAMVETVIGDAIRFADQVAVHLRRRALAATRWTLSLLADDAGAIVEHPLVDPAFAAALSRAGGTRGFGDRTAVMRALFADLLPDELLARSGKARFHYVYFRAASREFAHRFSGEGVDPELVDPEALRAAWLALMPSGLSALPLQAAWLAQDGSGGGEVEEPVSELG